MVIVFGVVVLGVLVGGNWYLWRRLFRDTTRGPGWARRAGAALIAVGWVLAITALAAERTGAPFWLQRVLSWPGFLWLAVSMYLLLGVLAGEVVRPLLRMFLERRQPETAVPEQEPARTPAVPAAAPEQEPARTPAAPAAAP
ncbi:metallophosphoesterase, partial [Streptomyces sp. S6]